MYLHSLLFLFNKAGLKPSANPEHSNTHRESADSSFFPQCFNLSCTKSLTNEWGNVYLLLVGSTGAELPQITQIPRCSEKTMKSMSFKWEICWILDYSLNFSFTISTFNEVSLVIPLDMTLPDSFKELRPPPQVYWRIYHKCSKTAKLNACSEYSGWHLGHQYAASWRSSSSPPKRDFLLLPYRWPNYKERKEEYCGDEKDISLCQLLILACVEVILLVRKYRGTLGLWLTRPSQPCLLLLRDPVMVQEKHLLLAAIFSGA